MNILISGAGIAGCTAAYWLCRGHHRVTLVERSTGQRSSGAPVDVRGAAVDVAEAMGLMPKLHAAATRVTGMTFLSGSGRTPVRIDTLAFQRATRTREVEIPRGALAQLLLESLPSGVTVRYGDSIAQLTRDAGGVDVSFEGSPAERFDLVIGADGLHSTVRSLAFAPESAAVRHMGLYVATLPLENADVGHELTMFNAPGRLLAVHPCREHAMAAFIFHRAEVQNYDHRDREQHKRLVSEAYATDGWLVPALLEQVRAAKDLYFDAVSSVRLERWSSGRVVLVGDAASCISLFGNGSSLAMAAGYTLAQELNATSDCQTALDRYEARHRLLTDPQHRAMGRGASVLVPKTQLGISARNSALRLWPLAVGAARLFSGVTEMGTRLLGSPRATGQRQG